MVYFEFIVDNEDLILGYLSGRIRGTFIRTLPGDRIKININSYD
uniref:Translation initiation factor 1 n=6 Tax=Epimedium TaxID=63350 RepID=A0A7L8Y2W7_9MAGN|nr:translation initiation factor 1 [Epimedium dewuense]YP_010014600.1 translation initiation factor 1 [Epimedium shuichengense]YP_010014685.1 translation initiation factor 1 [Epimedium simplicifolium]YP_010014769.1 translation initiation factor 1 [Epimedium ecalcaratum]YP_010014803.1 translation initiation factor 1 [Epimedium ecalcaratum]YP_010342447.1 translation initiation factor 1 [Epimedium baojingense]YP_010342532.1 translation initiation factor 1 [Epimedium leptorrhizum]YP_010342617.1 